MLDSVYAGKQAIESLQQAMPDDSHPDGQNQWKRKAQAFLAMFGENPSQQGDQGAIAQKVEGAPPHLLSLAY